MPVTPPPGAFHTKTRIERLLAGAGLAPRRRHGQHFLIDQNLMRRLVAESDIRPSDCVVEVGTGSGCLTGLLASQAAHVVTAEIDEGLARIAQAELSMFENVTLWRGDVLAGKSTLAPGFERAIREAAARAGPSLKLVANLPYEVATPVVMNLLLGRLAVSRMCFTVQAEVADRFLARPKTEQYGPVSIIVQALAEPRRICRVPPQAFWPAPRVSSTMLRLDIFSAGRRPVDDVDRFVSIVRKCFRHRRKTMRHICRRLSDGERLVRAMGELGLSPGLRPEQITTVQWIALCARRV